MNHSGSIPLHLQLARFECPLLADEDVEVVVGGVNSTVSFRAEGRTEDDQVLRDAGVNDVHGAHCTSGIIEDPFLFRVDANLVFGVRFREVRDDVVDHASRVIGGGRDCRLGKFMQEAWLEDIPAFLKGYVNWYNFYQVRCAHLYGIQPCKCGKKNGEYSYSLCPQEETIWR